MKSKNMNYVFNVEYFEGMNLLANTEDNKETIKNRNDAIKSFAFKEKAPYEVWSEISGYQEFSAFSLYPGLLIGTGNPHSIAVDGASKRGFMFDYVTGLPYIPGSSLKGMIRAYFPGDTADKEKDKEYKALIEGLLPDSAKGIDILELKRDMFEGEDIFLGAFPKADGPLLDMDYITPHKKFKNPNPISFIKVRPGVEFVFSAVFSDFKESGTGTVLLKAADKAELCKQLILLFGIGAKTNVGYGKFSLEKPVGNELLPAENKIGKKKPPKNNRPQEGKFVPRCKDCGKESGFYPDGKPKRFCSKCYLKNKKG